MDGYFTVDSVESKMTSKGDLFLVKAGGHEFSTFKADLARQARSLVGQQARVAYTEKQNGNFLNRYLEGIQAGGNQVASGGGFSAPAPEQPSSAARALDNGAKVGQIMGRNNIAAGAVATVLQFTNGDAPAIGAVLNALAHWSETGQWTGLGQPPVQQDEIPF